MENYVRPYIKMQTVYSYYLNLNLDQFKYRINTKDGSFKPCTSQGTEGLEVFIWLKADVQGIHPSKNTIEGAFLREMLNMIRFCFEN